MSSTDHLFENSQIIELFNLHFLLCYIFKSKLLANNQDTVLAGLRSVRPEQDYGNQDAEVGPWPECVGQSAVWCRDYIASWVGYSTYVKGEQRKGAVKLIRPYEYQVSRVWIHVDDSGSVLAVPERG